MTRTRATYCEHHYFAHRCPYCADPQSAPVSSSSNEEERISRATLQPQPAVETLTNAATTETDREWPTKQQEAEWASRVPKGFVYVPLSACEKLADPDYFDAPSGGSGGTTADVHERAAGGDCGAVGDHRSVALGDHQPSGDDRGEVARSVFLDWIDLEAMRQLLRPHSGLTNAALEDEAWWQEWKTLRAKIEGKIGSVSVSVSAERAATTRRSAAQDSSSHSASPDHVSSSSVEEARQAAIKELCSGACASFSEDGDNPGYCKHCNVVEQCHDEIAYLDTLIASVRAEVAQPLEECDKCHRRLPSSLVALEIQDGAPVSEPPDHKAQQWCVVCHDQRVLADFKQQVAEGAQQIAAVYALGKGPTDQARAIPLAQWVQTRFVHVEDYNEQATQLREAEATIQAKQARIEELEFDVSELMDRAADTPQP